MPLYEYKCDQCGEVFEVVQKFVDEPLRTHEKCGGAVNRLLSRSAFQFKGSGWYVTDYAKNAGSPNNGSSKKEEPTGKPSDKKEAGSGSTPTSTSSTKDSSKSSE